MSAALLPDRYRNKIQFWNASGLVDSDCWLWIGAVDKRSGYGRVQVDRRTRYVHRVVYELLVNPIPARLHIDTDDQMGSEPYMPARHVRSSSCTSQALDATDYSTRARGRGVLRREPPHPHRQARLYAQDLPDLCRRRNASVPRSSRGAQEIHVGQVRPAADY